MSWLVAIVGAIAGVAVVYQLVQNVSGPGQTPVTGLGTATSGLSNVTGKLFSKA